MPSRRRQPFIPLVALLRTREPPVEDPERAILDGRVLVDDRVVQNPRAVVRRDARVRLVRHRRLRGDVKLSAAFQAFDLDVTGAVAVDVGAAAGGFTTALLRHGAAKVYAVDVGFGQLAGSLRDDRRVVNLERTNVASLDRRLVPERVDVVTVDVSYTSIASVVAALDALDLGSAARLLTLVKPTFELRAATLVTDAQAVRRAIAMVTDAIAAHGWRCGATTVPTVTGRRGAVEAVVLACRGP